MGNDIGSLIMKGIEDLKRDVRENSKLVHNIDKDVAAIKQRMESVAKVLDIHENHIEKNQEHVAHEIQRLEDAIQKNAVQTAVNEERTTWEKTKEHIPTLGIVTVMQAIIEGVKYLR